MVPERPYSRLTVLAPRRAVDVALPADVPVADLVPMVLELVGEPDPNDVWRPEPFRLSGVAGGPLPGSATLAELGVLDGEMLRIGRDAPPPAAPVFDDPVDALAASTGAARHRDRQFGSVAVLLVVLAAAGLLASGGPGATGTALLAGCAALAALAVVRSAAGDPATGVARTAALAAVPLAAAAGWAGMSGPLGAGPALVAAASAGTAAAAGQVLLRVVEPALVAGVVTAVLWVAALLGARSGLPITAAGAAIAAVAVVVGPMLPRAAIRLAGLPRPVVPADGSELVDADSGPDLLPPDELAERADLARGYLAGLAAACAVTAAAGAVLAASAGGWAGPAFAGVTVVVLGLRARGYADAVPARVVMSAAIAGGVVLAGLAEGAVGTVAAAALLVAAAVGGLVLGHAQPLGSPVSRRAADLLEGVAVATSVPLALAAMDLYRVVREW